MLPEQENNIIDDSNTETPGKGKSFLFDFKEGEFSIVDGKVTATEGYEALKTWIIKVLKTESHTYKIYDGSDYGIINLRRLISSGYPYAYVKAEIEREVRENLVKNKNIVTVENFKFSREKRKIKCEFDCITNFGVIKSEVII